MQVTDVHNPGERKKLIWAGILGLVAIILLWWTFFGFGGTSKPASPAQSSSTPALNIRVQTQSQPQAVNEIKQDDLNNLRPVVFEMARSSAPEAKRNIFAYYEPPRPPVVTSTPTPTPTPTPPVLLASLSPAMVYARTGDFTLEVAGDKFAPGLRIVVDNNELQTRYVSPQQLSATVPASLIGTVGSRQVMLRSHDGKLYSNGAALDVAAAPTPNYSYIGIIGTPRFIDTAILQDRGNREVLNIQKGDLLGGRFRVTSISEKELVVVDTNLKIKHVIPFSIQGASSGPQQRATPRVESEDDEP